jgi:hypothetical protein
VAAPALAVTISDVPPVYPSYGGTVTMRVTLAAQGGTEPVQYSVLGYFIISGTSTVVGHLGAPSPYPATGTLTPGQVTVVVLTSGSMDCAQDVGYGYQALRGLDIQLVVTNTTTGEQEVYYLPSVVFLAQCPWYLT